MTLPDCNHKFVEPNTALVDQDPECELDVKIPENYDPTKTYHGRKCKWLFSHRMCPQGFMPNPHLTEDQKEVMRTHGIGLKEICEWWLQTYPSDIFIGKEQPTKLIVEIRERMREILKLGK